MYFSRLIYKMDFRCNDFLFRKKIWSQQINCTAAWCFCKQAWLSFAYCRIPFFFAHYFVWLTIWNETGEKGTAPKKILSCSLSITVCFVSFFFWVIIFAFLVLESYTFSNFDLTFEKNTSALPLFLSLVYSTIWFFFMVQKKVTQFR